LPELKDNTGRPHRTGRSRATALGVGLGATLALSPLVWAENFGNTPPQAGATAPETMTSSAALIQQQSFAPLVKKVSPAVVNISVTQNGSPEAMAEEPELGPTPGFPNSPFDEFLRRFFDQQMPNGERHLFPQSPESQAHRIALGSGFIIDPSGYVVTNNHVVGNAGKVEVTLQDDSKYPAKIIGRDPKTDIAILKVKADKPLPYVTFGDSSAAQVGDWVMAVGNPFGLGGTVTTGIISARGRDIHSGPFDDFLQIDAPINRGNSGGPTFNLEGQVIGINTAIYSPNGGSVGIGFAVPSNVAKNVVAQLEEHGKVERGWLGLALQPVLVPEALQSQTGQSRGLMIMNISRDSPAAQANLQPGDILLTIGGESVASPMMVARRLGPEAVGQPVELRLIRAGGIVSVSATVGTRPTG